MTIEVNEDDDSFYKGVVWRHGVMTWPFPPDIDSGASSWWCSGVSGDGSKIGGSVELPSDSNGEEPWLWSPAGTLVLNPTLYLNYATNISEDGSTVIGYGYDPHEPRPYRIRGGIARAMQGVGYAFATSWNGDLVFGQAYLTNGHIGAVVWTPDNHAALLGPGTGDGYPLDCGRSGLVIVGYLLGATLIDHNPVRWDYNGSSGIETPLGRVGDYRVIDARGTDEHGTLMVGAASGSPTGAPDVAVAWNINGVCQRLADYLAETGADFTGWTLDEADDLSPSGRYIVGVGMHNGQRTAFLITRIVGRCTPDFNQDGDPGTDADIEAFFACLGGDCCVSCGDADFNGDGDVGTDADIDSFFRVLGGGSC
jgi:hypothetical protein